MFMEWVNRGRTFSVTTPTPLAFVRKEAHMMWRVALLSIAAPLLAQQQNVDLVLVLDASPGMQRSLSVAFFRPDPADRVAVLAVTSKSRLAQSFTNDRQKLTAAIEGLGRRSAVPVSLGMAPSPSEPKIRLFRALLDAARLFQSLPVVPGRHRVILAVFGTDDKSFSPTADEVKLALSAAQITAFGIPVPRHDYQPALDPRLATPPTLPGTVNRTPGDLAPLPEATMTRLAACATVIRADAASGNASILAILNQVRSSPTQNPPQP